MNKTQVLKSPQPSKKEARPLPDALQEVSDVCKMYAKARGELAGLAGALDAELSDVTERHWPGIQANVAAVKDLHRYLNDLITREIGSFEKPKTHIFHGYEVGVRKQPGKISFADDAKAIKLIEKHFADQFDAFVETIYAVRKSAVSSLSVDDLKRIGGSITDAGDQIVIKPVGSEVSKTVAALLKDGQK